MGLEWCGLLVDYCDVFISCLDSHSDGTHSLQRIHCCPIMKCYIFQISSLFSWTNKHIYILDGLWVSKLSANFHFWWTIPLIWWAPTYQLIGKWVTATGKRYITCICICQANEQKKKHAGRNTSLLSLLTMWHIIFKLLVVRNRKYHAVYFYHTLLPHFTYCLSWIVCKIWN